MAKEIERKFLIDIEKWGFIGNPIEMKQAYLAIDSGKIIRIRIARAKAFLAIKGNLQGITRDEFEYSVPVEDAKQLLKLCVGYSIEKTRYIYKIDEVKWEIDVFHGVNDGLVVAEIELKSEGQSINKPDWILEEVSTDEKYFNFNLSKHPFTKW